MKKTWSVYCKRDIFEGPKKNQRQSGGRNDHNTLFISWNYT